MADIVKLKKKAADFEAKKQLDKALDVYVEIVEAYEAGDEDTIDIPFYNRVGDMLQKAGKVGEAVTIWEKAVDRYAEGGFFNPAIALCNKILRQSPGRTVIYYKLGKIHAEKGFKGDARQHFLEYASRQQKAGNLDEVTVLDAEKSRVENGEALPAADLDFASGGAFPEEGVGAGAGFPEFEETGAGFVGRRRPGAEQRQRDQEEQTPHGVSTGRSIRIRYFRIRR